MDGLLLSGGSDISPEFLRQDVPDPSVLDKQIDPERDRWEFQAVQNALSRGLPILAICKGLQVFNVALGGTLKLDIQGHNLPDQKHRDVQSLRSARGASHRFPKVNSAHHQAIDQLGDDWKWRLGPRMTGLLSRCDCANTHSDSPFNIIQSGVDFTIRCSTISSRDWNRQKSNGSTAHRSNKITYSAHYAEPELA